MNGTLLPYNASKLERDVEASTRHEDRLAEPIDAILEFRSDPPASAEQWLVWEYGLQALLPFLPTPRDVIEQGLVWQRMRGTPASLLMALGWLELGTPAIEEELPNTLHWAEFMIDPGAVIDERQTLVDTVMLSNVSKPLRSRLSRIFHGYDIRRFVLDHSDWGDLLSDYSGIYDAELGVRISFGRHFKHVIEHDHVAPSLTHTRTHAMTASNDANVLWDYGEFGDAQEQINDFIYPGLPHSGAVWSGTVWGP